jgi:UPF0755 protein
MRQGEPDGVVGEAPGAPEDTHVAPVPAAEPAPPPPQPAPESSPPPIQSAPFEPPHAEAPSVEEPSSSAQSAPESPPSTQPPFVAQPSYEPEPALPEPQPPSAAEPAPLEPPTFVEEPALPEQPRYEPEPLVVGEPPVEDSLVVEHPPNAEEPPGAGQPPDVAEPPVIVPAPHVATPPPPATPPPFEPPLAPQSSGLPPLPPALGAASVVGAGRVRSRRARSLLARFSALVALAAVIAAVVLLLHGQGAKTAPPVAPSPVVKVLIPEGKTRMQISQIATADGLSGSYRLASRHSALLDPTTYGAAHGTPDLEGFLFPATYDMDRGASVNHLVEEQLNAFRENFGASEIARAKALHVTPYQLLIVASMIEREAQVTGDRPKIAAVIYNRLAQGMPLGIDASIYYAIELKTGVATYTHELTEAQLHVNSAYNTRTHVGLPPTPISNPGVASIEAAAHPAHDAYLYYVAGADGCGEQVFSNTLAEFEANAAVYKAAVARSGGRPPSCKHK